MAICNMLSPIMSTTRHGFGSELLCTVILAIETSHVRADCSFWLFLVDVGHTQVVGVKVSW
eukprot:COSAG02_NODE_1638_length_11542_cov_13.473739_10_plen_61_part_00